jgi:amino acid transporter
MMRRHDSAGAPRMSSHDHNEDTQLLHRMGYAQELHRRMGLFQNFAISFSIICILAGGITAFPQALSAAGGASLGIGWPIAWLFALMVALALGQIASAYPTAGGIYHWASMLGNRGFGWTAAWLNLLGLLFVVSSVNFGLFLLFRDLLLDFALGVDVSGWKSRVMFDHGWWVQTAFLSVVTLSQATINHYGIGLTSKLTDFSGYMIFFGAIVLTSALLWSAPSIELSRLWTFTDFTGAAGGDVWAPAGERWLSALMPPIAVALYLGLLQGVYTITGFDASGHTAEETRNAAREVPKGMLHSVVWSGLFGWVMVCAFVLALPSVEKGAAMGLTSFNLVMAQVKPEWLRVALIGIIVVVNYICALSTLTATSRMLFAFSRDDGVPWLSTYLRKVSPAHRSPAHAIWASAALAIVATLYGNVFVVLSTGSAVFIYASYAMPIAAGLFSEGTRWTRKGPFDLGAWSRPVSVLALLGSVALVIVGVQPPNEKVGYLLAGGLFSLVVVWWTVERRRFMGPPSSDEAIRARQGQIAAAEKAVGESG